MTESTPRMLAFGLAVISSYFIASRRLRAIAM
jgi:hypothetical protein